MRGIVYGGRDEPGREPVTIGLSGSAATMELTMRDDCASLQLSLPESMDSITAGEEPFFTVYAVPDFDSTSEVQPETLRASTGGSVTLSGLTPGELSRVYVRRRRGACLSEPRRTGGNLKSRAGDSLSPLRPATWCWRCLNNDALSQSERRFCFCVGMFWALAASGALAQTGAAGAYNIAGTVVNAVTGAPVPGATVAVLSVEDSHRIAAVESGNDGSFAIAGLAAAKYQLTASKRGYSTAAFDEHGNYSSAVVTGPEQDTSGLVFKLMPGAVLRGDSDGRWGRRYRRRAGNAV